MIVYTAPKPSLSESELLQILEVIGVIVLRGPDGITRKR